MALSNTNIGGRADEYITACLFTTHLATNTTYSPQYTFGSFVYYGQFQDGDNDGSREGDVTLRQLWDNTTADQVEAAVAAGSLDALVMINGGENATYAGKPIAATDHTRIGWTNTGVNKVVSSVSNADTGGSEKTFQIGDELKFTTSIYGGQMLGSNSIDQGVLIDPVLVISLPEGMSLDLTSVTATSEAGSYGGSKVYLVQDGEATEKVINGVTWTTYRFKSPEMLALVAEEYHLNNTKDAAENYISATFNVLVDPGCVDYTLSLQDMMMWDVRNTAYEPDTLGTVTASSENGDAAVSGEGNFTIEDKNNLMGHGTKYKLAAGTGEIVIKPNIDLHVDLGIKPVTNQDDSRAVSGFTTYNGLSSSIVSVIPDRYADIRVTYRSTSTTPYYAGTVIYVPIPKKGEDYAKYFENIELDNPVEKQITETFDFTMDLTGHVTLESSQGEKWNTYYALRTVSSNPNDYSNDITNWEPVVQNGGTVDWLIADQVTDWTKVAMVKFVATADVEPEETGAGVMRLHIHNVNDPDGPAVGGGVNYWRGYCEAVIDQNAMTGNWKYTSVVAATPAVETLVGQIFIDGDQDGIFDSSEPGYQPGTKPYAYTVELKKDDGTMAVRNLAVHSDGSFALVDDDGDTEYLPAGSYTLTVRKNADPNFYFANTGSYIGQESTADQWRNNVSSSNGTVATWKLTVSNDRKETVVHRVGIGLKSSVPVTIQGIKTFSNGSLKAGDYAFRMETDTPNAPVDNTLAENRADGSFSFQQLRFEFPGTYVYRITEDRSNPIPGVNYDGHTATVTVQVNQSSTGVLSATVTYNNSEALTDADRAITDRAAFTNAYGYELPETGGAGTTSYTMGGLLIMLMAAAILLYIHSQKRGKEERPSF